MTVTWDFCDAGCTLTGSHHGTLSAIKRRPPAQAGWKPSIEFVFVVDCGPSAGEIVTRRLPESFTRVGDLYQFLRITCGGEVPAGLAPASLLGRRFALTMVPRDDKFTRVGCATPVGPDAPSQTINVQIERRLQEIQSVQQPVQQFQQVPVAVQPPVQQPQPNLNAAAEELF